ncbi:hypothetical protein ACEUZ9_000174 [Paracoccus litorisediminis]|uniref:hypothetical protein n=1 Tax=Paracoccus litorisediminis TaxID=2006130 RepID=UPI003732234E
MKGPRYPESYEDRFTDCEFDLEADILAVLDRAEAVGWGRAEAITAITSLADHIALGDAAMEDSWERLQKALKHNRGEK